MKKRMMMPMASEMTKGMGLAPCGGGDECSGSVGAGVSEEAEGMMDFFWGLWRGWKRESLVGWERKGSLWAVGVAEREFRGPRWVE